MSNSKHWVATNVNTFKGHDVVNGEVEVCDSLYTDHLDEMWGDVVICGMTYSSGRALQELDPVAYRCGKNDFGSELDSELERQLENEDDTDIEFIEELDDEEDED
jgi:hypothetical protein